MTGAVRAPVCTSDVACSLQRLEEENTLLHRMSRQDMGDLRRSRAETQQTMAELKELRQELAAARGLRSELMAVKARNEILQSDLRRTADIRAHNQRLAEENQLLLKQSRSDQHEISSHDRDVNELRLQVSQWRERAEAAERDAEELRAHLEHSSREVCTLREVNSDLEEQLKVLLQEQDRLGNEDWQEFWHRKAARDVERYKEESVSSQRGCSPTPASAPTPSLAQTVPVRQSLTDCSPLRRAAATPEAQALQPAGAPPLAAHSLCSPTPGRACAAAGSLTSPCSSGAAASAPFKTVRQLRQDERRRQEMLLQEEDMLKKEAAEQAAAAAREEVSAAARAAAEARLELERERAAEEEAVACLSRARASLQAAAKADSAVNGSAGSEGDTPAGPPAPPPPIVAVDGEKGVQATASHMFLIRREGGGDGEWEPAARVSENEMVARYVASQNGLTPDPP
eukprot:TRINITY_DN26743_c0_g2_i1.p1 TRINITY_DN26743_c0_g2~~TRINITY_DN26743_c0_g2_i1.p1  ORF type:complete len:457 (+),score=153.92 TRINITY_DN26743_c0_g2_i1:102-1472(+)